MILPLIEFEPAGRATVKPGTLDAAAGRPADGARDDFSRAFGESLRSSSQPGETDDSTDFISNATSGSSGKDASGQSAKPAAVSTPAPGRVTDSRTALERGTERGTISQPLSVQKGEQENNSINGNSEITVNTSAAHARWIAGSAPGLGSEAAGFEATGFEATGLETTGLETTDLGATGIRISGTASGLVEQTNAERGNLADEGGHAQLSATTVNEKAVEGRKSVSAVASPLTAKRAVSAQRTEAATEIKTASSGTASLAGAAAPNLTRVVDTVDPGASETVQTGLASSSLKAVAVTGLNVAVTAEATAQSAQSRDANQLIAKVSSGGRSQESQATASAAAVVSRPLASAKLTASRGAAVSGATHPKAESVANLPIALAAPAETIGRELAGQQVSQHDAGGRVAPSDVATFQSGAVVPVAASSASASTKDTETTRALAALPFAAPEQSTPEQSTPEQSTMATAGLSGSGDAHSKAVKAAPQAAQAKTQSKPLDGADSWIATNTAGAAYLTMAHPVAAGLVEATAAVHTLPSGASSRRTADGVSSRGVTGGVQTQAQVTSLRVSGEVDAAANTKPASEPRTSGEPAATGSKVAPVRQGDRAASPFSLSSIQIEPDSAHADGTYAVSAAGNAGRSAVDPGQKKTSSDVVSTPSVSTGSDATATDGARVASTSSASVAAGNTTQAVGSHGVEAVAVGAAGAGVLAAVGVPGGVPSLHGGGALIPTASVHESGFQGPARLDAAATDGAAITEPHRTLLATPTALEVGVPDGTQGWLKIRAEVGQQGQVNASVAAGSSAGQEMLHRELPALNAYLHSERMAVTATVSERSFVAAGGSQSGLAEDSSRGAAANGGLAQGGAGTGGQQGDSGPQVAGSSASDARENGDRRPGDSSGYSSVGDMSATALLNSPSATAPFIGTGPDGASGRWLNIRA